jgi:hypothetical protein
LTILDARACQCKYFENEILNYNHDVILQTAVAISVPIDITDDTFKQDRQCTYYVILRGVHENIVAVEK